MMEILQTTWLTVHCASDDKDPLNADENRMEDKIMIVMYKGINNALDHLRSLFCQL